MPDLNVSTLQCTVTDELALQVSRLFTDPGGPAVLMIHGLAEDSGIFCPRNGAGLAVFLAEAGFDVFVADLRGHGASPPRLAPGVSITQHDIVCQDMPALFELIEAHHPGEHFFAVGHAWGSVLLAAALTRQPAWLDRVAGLIHFAARRVSRRGGWRHRLMVETLWAKVMPALGKRQGLIPARSLGIGSNDVSLALHAGQLAWSRGAEWRDLEDGFDYALRLEELSWPAGLYLAGKHDKYLGQFDDVKAFAREFGPHDMQLILLQKGTGCSRNYGHNDLLTHPQASLDHFPLVLAWMQQRIHGAKTNESAA
ncbi:Serine aminopeptidase, S33 [Halopseudomonas xinjiangensis]|uniref:Serine aminopeptidase, S33 n=1 Tax=Halopseudomonas xinjiangensis TaxID=487184 RepID=A0A1H1Q2A3_9GAMM|nr:alpha/beta hydrolase [Halopseudomonas xinjiangensis]SDS17565.1 Serine aminopeptidase, S33 [Halopseudomonas xinjiangensis]